MYVQILLGLLFIVKGIIGIINNNTLLNKVVKEKLNPINLKKYGYVYSRCTI